VYAVFKPNTIDAGWDALLCRIARQYRNRPVRRLVYPPLRAN
jgi:hypothetical protein